jgi:eukaryotic-like serine/threonine-protein kinase
MPELIRAASRARCLQRAGSLNDPGPDGTLATMSEALLDGKYRLLEELGSGGMGTVHRAEQVATGRHVAVKTLAETGSSEALARFAREARAAGSLMCRHVVAVIDAGSDGNKPYLVMELLDGEDCAMLCRRLGPIEPLAALRIVRQVARALEHAHAAGILHRDVKPANVFLARQRDGSLLVKLLDFGIAKVMHDQGELTRSGNMPGSPKYMSPEQIQGLRGIDARTDVYSAGVLLYALLAGRTPHEECETAGELMVVVCTRPAPPIQRFAPWVDGAVAAVVDRALGIDPATRFADGRALGEALDALLDDDDRLVPALVVPVDDAERVHAVERGPTQPTRPVATDDLSVEPLASSRIVIPMRRLRRAGIAFAVAVIVAGFLFVLALDRGSAPAPVPAAREPAPVAGEPRPAATTTITADAGVPAATTATASSAVVPSGAAALRAPPTHTAQAPASGANELDTEFR